MFSNKYGKVLTVFLIVAILAIVGLVGFWLFDKINGDKIKKDGEAAIEEFNRNTEATVTPTPDTDDSNGDDGEQVPDIIETIPTPSNNNSNNTSSDGKTKYGGFVMLGYIEIPRTNVKVPILEKVTKKSLEIAVAVLYPLDAKLNEPGNIVIAGHNYRNQLFFSNNKKLQEGDKIYITDANKRTMTYIVYKNFEASPEDTSFYERDTGGVPEITLTTCTQDSSKRTIILARAQ